MNNLDNNEDYKLWDSKLHDGLVVYDNKEYKIFDTIFPFHNDFFMMTIMIELLNNADFFVETGTYIGDTSGFVALNFNNLKVFTCEIIEESYNKALKKLNKLSNVTAVLEKSPDALYNLENYYNKDIYNNNVVFWIDAHWGELPLNKEIDYITKNFNNYCIFIDDFQNPYDSGFTNDGDDFNINIIKNFIHNKENVKVYFPSYPSNHIKCSFRNIHDVPIPPRGYCIITNQNLKNYDSLKLFPI